MTYERFLKLTLGIQKNDRVLSELNKLGIDLINFSDGYYVIIDELTREIWTKEGVDWLNWFMWEADFGQKADITAHDENGKPICYSHESTYEYLKQYEIESEIESHTASTLRYATDRLLPYMSENFITYPLQEEGKYIPFVNIWQIAKSEKVLNDKLLEIFKDSGYDFTVEPYCKHRDGKYSYDIEVSPGWIESEDCSYEFIKPDWSIEEIVNLLAEFLKRDNHEHQMEGDKHIHDDQDATAYLRDQLFGNKSNYNEDETEQKNSF